MIDIELDFILFCKLSTFSLEIRKSFVITRIFFEKNAFWTWTGGFSDQKIRIIVI
jgi:hypothetical protein